MISADTETTLIQPALLAPPLACITWTESPDVEPDIVHGSDPAARRVAERILSQHHIGANFAFDLAVFGAKWPDMLPLIFESLSAGRSHDVILRQKLCDIADGCYRMQEVDTGGEEPVYRSQGYSLSDLCARHLGYPLEKDQWRLTYGRLRHQPLAHWPAGAVQYAKTDARAALLVQYAQERAKLRAPFARAIANEVAQADAAFSLQLISCWGIMTDAEEVRQFLAKIDVEQEQRREHLIREGLVRPGGARNENEAKERMRRALGDRCVLTKTGLEKLQDWWRAAARARTLTEESKQAERKRLMDAGYVSLKADVCQGTGDSTLLEYARYGQFQLLRSKIAKLETRGLPVQTSFEVLLETGRTSSSASKVLPNSAAIQNLPRKQGMRECFVPRAERVLVACDYGMAELVSLSQITYGWFGYSRMRDRLNTGIDLHLALAGDFLDLGYDQALARKEELGEYRQMGKAFHFGTPGMLGPDKFVAYAKSQYNVTFAPTHEDAVERVRALRRIFFKRYPEVREYLNLIARMCERDPQGLCDIEQLTSGRLRGRVPAPVAANTMFQGLTADAFKAALCAVQRRCYVGVPGAHGYVQTALFGARVVAPVHDEILLEVREEHAHEAAMELRSVMVEEYQRWTPDVRIDAEPVVMRRWRKGAKPAWRNGRLIPYEDRDHAVAA